MLAFHLFLRQELASLASGLRPVLASHLFLRQELSSLAVDLLVQVPYRRNEDILSGSGPGKPRPPLQAVPYHHHNSPLQCTASLHLKETAHISTHTLRSSSYSTFKGLLVGHNVGVLHLGQYPHLGGCSEGVGGSTILGVLPRDHLPPYGTPPSPCGPSTGDEGAMSHGGDAHLQTMLTLEIPISLMT